MQRITIEPGKMGGKPCMNGLRMAVWTTIGLLAAKKPRQEMLALHPCLEGQYTTAAVELGAFMANNHEHSSHWHEEPWID